MALQASSGCYYGHLARGQTRILWGRLEIADVLADPETPPPLADRLRLVGDARDFGQNIGLEVDGQYTSYLPWPGDRIITTLVTTRPGQIEAQPFHFPLLGAVPYKGFFDEAMAEREATRLRDEGMDVCVSPVRAYSTLGYFDDPVSGPMLRTSPGRLVETILHELVHSTVFLEGQSDFNEGAANFIGQEASVLFFAAEPEKAQRRRQEVRDSRALARFLLDFRDEIALLYGESGNAATLPSARAASEEEARKRLLSLPLATYDPEQFSDSIALNDACLALRGTYSEDIPLFEVALAQEGGDLSALIARLRAAAETEKPRAAFFRDAEIRGSRRPVQPGP